MPSVAAFKIVMSENEFDGLLNTRFTPTLSEFKKILSKWLFVDDCKANPASLFPLPLTFSILLLLTLYR